MRRKITSISGVMLMAYRLWGAVVCVLVFIIHTAVQWFQGFWPGGKLDLVDAGKLALEELNLIDTQGFDPDRFRERIKAIDALSRAIRKAEGST